MPIEKMTEVDVYFGKYGIMKFMVSEAVLTKIQSFERPDLVGQVGDRSNSKNIYCQKHCRKNEHWKMIYVTHDSQSIYFIVWTKTIPKTVAFWISKWDF